jgi:hypothetical protein
MSTTAPPLTEAQMLAGLKAAAKGLGYFVFHNTYSIGSDRGFPDLVIVGHERTFFLELKGPKGRVRPEQDVWINALFDAGHDARIVWPDDYDTILRELQIVYQRAMRREA